MIGRSFHAAQCDWLKGSPTREVWLPSEIAYSCCDVLAQNTRYFVLWKGGVSNKEPA